ncbi:MAG: hypothetical protein ACRD3Q_06415 [Terriglobales bacterium]
MGVQLRAAWGVRFAKKLENGRDGTWGWVEILAAKKMVAATEYVGWLCLNRACGLVIAIADIAASDALHGPTPVVHGPDHTPVIECPRCQNEDLYRWDARERRIHVPKKSEA